ncbi:MAG: right-handed parallel beta-helix repeat-containing protein [Clostridia bacterium]|nr:right-handed parallel beta-helix repeat-containing protein [Clostridia bacterium]
MNIQKEISKLRSGGKIYLPVGRYDISEPIGIDTPCVKLEGEVWNYSSDPNGVFESDFGTKLKLTGGGFPAIRVGESRTLGGNIIKDIGIAGDFVGMDTRESFDYQNPSASSGICFDAVRVDQGEVSKVSFCGLGSAVCVTGDSEIDAVRFEKLNTDGCCIGIYFAPRASYYALFKSCICADNPRYGFLANGENSSMHNLRISECYFVRNGGAFTEKDRFPRAAVTLYQVSRAAVENNVFDLPGVFWYYEPDAANNRQKEVFKQKTPALWVEGNKNRIIGNTFTHCTAPAITVIGDGNVIMNNITDGDIVIKGNNNIVSGNVFTNPNARLIIEEGSEGNEIINSKQ